MKKGLRFIIALLTLGSLGIWFLPVAKLAGIEVSVIDVFMTGIGYYDKNSLEGVVYAAAQPYVEPYMWIIAAAAGIVVIEAILAAVLRKKAAYGMGIIISLVNSGAFVALYIILNNELGEIKKWFGLVQMDGAVSLSYVPLYAWIAVYALILLLSVIGIILWRKPKKKDAEELYLEQISRAEAERARRQAAPERREAPAYMGYPEHRYEQTPGNGRQMNRRAEPVPVAPEDYWHPAEFQQDEKPLETPQQENRDEMWAAKAEQARENEPDAAGSFEGAVVCESGRYAGKAYPLEDKKEIFFFLREGEAELAPYEAEGAAAGVYYISEYGEYCAEPFERNMVFLESGQPLGKGRQYYLPRGTKIYISAKNNIFTLA